MIPLAISARLDETGSREPIGEHPVAVGDVRRLTSAGVSRLVLVLSVDAATGTGEVALIHTYSEYATGDDVVVPATVTALQYDIVAQGDLCAHGWTADLGKLVAVVPGAVVEAMLGGADADIVARPLWRGLPLTGPFDARWDFKVSEGDELRTLTASAMRSILGGDDSNVAEFDRDRWGLEFDEIVSEILQAPLDVNHLLLALYELWIERSDSLDFTIGQLVRHGESGKLELQAWNEALGDRGTLFHAAVIVPLIEKARSSYVSENEATPATIIGIEELRVLQNA